MACLQQGDHRLSGPPSGQGAGGGTRTIDRRALAYPRADSLSTVLPTPPSSPQQDDLRLSGHPSEQGAEVDLETAIKRPLQISWRVRNPIRHQSPLPLPGRTE
ncbi:hypothetical protein PoB_003007900 [Plakobranchus ocellatus]|uniref:Uncharacterized protein n=1 Tax=Plakobranchus ocellatus TaxID=259542 RepID=A0AAV4A7D2_9GAST|nr:hypothetical protein PoB_003007900 [Plakobranchus ocellatus]